MSRRSTSNQKTRSIPTLRVAAPVYAPDGKPFGIVIINVDMGPAFERLRKPTRPGEAIYIVGANGDYLVHPDKSRQFGSQFGRPTNWQADFPYFAHLLGTSEGGASIIDDADGRPGGAALAPALLAGKQWLGVIETVPNSVFMAPAKAIRNTSLVVGLIAVLCAAALAVIVARSLTGPILRLTAAVERIGRPDATAIPVDAGGETGVLARAFARAIDEANAKAAALEERRRIFETSQDLILISDSGGMLVQVSPSAETILGYRPEEMIGRNGIDFIHPDDLEQARREMRNARRGVRLYNTDSRYIHKDGRAVTLSWMGAWSEPVKRHFFVGRDMTESRHAQETLRESEQLARNIIETSVDAFLQIDESGAIRMWNSQAEKLFGWTREEALGKDVIDLVVVGDDHNELKAAFGRFLRSGQEQILGRRREILVRRRDGKEFRAELSVTAMRTRTGVLFNGFARDLSDKIAAEERIRQSEKMEAVGQLTGGFAHDFTNILTVITGTIEILADAVGKEPRLAAITRMIDEAAARGADLTQHLLAFARRQPLQPRETDINMLILDTAKLLRPTLGEHVEIETAFRSDACVAIVDPNQLATAIINLALNSRDAGLRLHQTVGRPHQGLQRRGPGHDRPHVPAARHGSRGATRIRTGSRARRWTRDRSGGRGRSPGAGICADATALARLRHAGCRQRCRGAGAGRQEREVRSVVHRRDHAGRDERPPACGHDSQGPAGSQGAVHLRLYRERHHSSRQAGSGRAVAGKALSQIRSRQDDPQGAGRLALLPEAQDARCAVITMRTRSAAFFAPNFFMMLAR
jgi:PAS domain S-box-containing protein